MMALYQATGRSVRDADECFEFARAALSSSPPPGTPPDDFMIIVSRLVSGEQTTYDGPNPILQRLHFAMSYREAFQLDIETVRRERDDLKAEVARLRAAPPPGGEREAAWKCPDCGSTRWDRNGARALDEAREVGFAQGIEAAARLVKDHANAYRARGNTRKAKAMDFQARDIRALAAAPAEGAPGCGRMVPDGETGLRCNWHASGEHQSRAFKAVMTDEIVRRMPLAAAPAQPHDKENDR